MLLLWSNAAAAARGAVPPEFRADFAKLLATSTLSYYLVTTLTRKKNKNKNKNKKITNKRRKESRHSIQKGHLG